MRPKTWETRFLKAYIEKITCYMWDFRFTVQNHHWNRSARHFKVAPWCSGYHYCTTSFTLAWTQALHRFKSSSQHVRDFQWWGCLKMVLARNKAKRLLLVNHATKTIHHHHHQWNQYQLQPYTTILAVAGILCSFRWLLEGKQIQRYLTHQDKSSTKRFLQTTLPYQIQRTSQDHYIGVEQDIQFSWKHH